MPTTQQRHHQIIFKSSPQLLFSLHNTLSLPHPSHIVPLINSIPYLLTDIFVKKRHISRRQQISINPTITSSSSTPSPHPYVIIIFQSNAQPHMNDNYSPTYNHYNPKRYTHHLFHPCHLHISNHFEDNTRLLLPFQSSLLYL